MEQVIPDNDQLAAELAIAVKADLLILLSDVDGVYTGIPGEPGSMLLRTYRTGTDKLKSGIKFWSKSSIGKGGMESKVYKLL